MVSPVACGVSVYISLTTPPKIIRTTPEWLETFGLEVRHCLGRTLNVIVGPETNPGKVNLLVDAVRSGSSSASARIVLYTSVGEKRLYTVRSRQARGALGVPPICKLTMQVSDAVPFKTAALDDGLCKVIVHAEKPFRIVGCTDAFERRYGLSREQAVNRTLDIIQGPETDMKAWLALFDSAMKGIAQQSAIMTYARDGSALRESVLITPVLGGQDVDFIVVTMELQEEKDRLDEQDLSGAKAMLGTMTSMVSPVACGVSVYISLTTPPKIIRTTPEWLETFGLEVQHCLGRTLNVIVGPETDPGKVNLLVDAVRSGSSSASARIVLYTSVGEKRLYTVRSRQARGALGVPPICKLTMQVSDAVPFKTAALDDGLCKVIVHAEKPFRIVGCTDAFERRYGLSREQAVNRTLDIIQGPERMKAWLALFDSAMKGIAQQSAIMTYARDGSALRERVLITPVLGGQDVDFIVVTMELQDEQQQQNGFEEQEADRFLRSQPKQQPLTWEIEDANANSQGHACVPTQSGSSCKRPSGDAFARHCAPSIPRPAVDQPAVDQPAVAKQPTDARPNALPSGLQRRWQLSSSVYASSPALLPQKNRIEKSASMGSVTKLIELQVRAHRKAKAERAVQKVQLEDEQRAVSVDLSNGLLPFAISLVVSALVALNLTCLGWLLLTSES